MEVYPNMPAYRLEQRSEELSISLKTIEHCPERKAQIQRELSIIAFEMYCQYQEKE